MINTAKAYGRSVEVISNINRAETLLRAGYPLIFYINVGIGHAVVVSDYDNTNGRVNINDPYGKLFYPSGKQLCVNYGDVLVKMLWIGMQAVLYLRLSRRKP